MRVTVKDVVWLAGLLEGEGSFFTYRNSPTISVNMTDRDIIDRAAILLRSNVHICRPAGTRRKTPYSTSAHGAIAVGWMLTLYQFMGERRKSSIRQSIILWKNRTSRPKTPRGGWWGAACHLERKVYCLGLCRSCYGKEKIKNETPEAAEIRKARSRAWIKNRRERDKSRKGKEF